MTLAQILIWCIPVAFILITFFAIGAAAARAFRMGKRVYVDIKPQIDELTRGAALAQQKAAEFSERGNQLSKNFEEISGRFAFITETLSESTNSPAVKVAEVAGRFLK
jgi:hypothetical protein